MTPTPTSIPAMTRRDWLAASAMLLGSGAVAAAPVATAAVPSARFRFCLNTATIRGQKLPLDREVEVAAKAGYDAIEPWVENIGRFVEAGGSLADLRRRIEDAGLTVEGAIGFAPWCVDDAAQRASGLEQAKRDMEMVASIGGKRIAAPPAGVPNGARVEAGALAERYGKLLEIGTQTGVTPILEFWARNPSLGQLGTALQIAAACGHAKACVLADVFHMYRGGSPFEGLRLLAPPALPLLHLNDYPAAPPLDKITDGDRVFPGDGIAPLATIFGFLRETGARPVLSLELFNAAYYKLDALEVARRGLAKMRAACGMASVE